VQDCEDLVAQNMALVQKEQAKASRERRLKEEALRKMTLLQSEVIQLRRLEGGTPVGGAPGRAGKATASAAGAGGGKAPSSPAKAAPLAPRPGTKASEP